MSINLPTRLSEKLPSAFNKLVESDRIHKKDLTALHSFVQKISKAKASQVPLSSMALILKMGPCAKDPRTLQKSFSTLFSKLDMQKSSVREDKQAKLEYIQRELTHFVKDLHQRVTKNQLDNINHEINKISKSISSAENKIHQHDENISIAGEKIKTLSNEIKPLVTTAEETSDEEFATLDAERAEETAIALSTLKTKYDADIASIDDQICEEESFRSTLLEFAQAHDITNRPGKKSSGFASAVRSFMDFATGKWANSVEEDIHLAEEKDIIYFNDLGQKRTLPEYMCSDEYAMKKFGHILIPGRHEYSPPEKMPNARAREWQRMMEAFNKSPKISALAREKIHLAAEYQNWSDAIDATNMNSSIGEIVKKIEYRQKNINTLEQQIKTESEHIASTKNTANALAIKKENLLKRKEELYAQIDKR